MRDKSPDSSNFRVVVSGNTVERSSSDGIGFYMGSSTPSQDCPPSGTIERNLNYRAGLVNRVIKGRRIYECIISGTTAAFEPGRWGTTDIGEIIIDGSSAWIDRGIINSQAMISGNTVRYVDGCGVSLKYVYDVTVAENVIEHCGLSGIEVASNANRFALLQNKFSKCNESSESDKAPIRVVAFTGAPHIAILDDEVLGRDIVAFDSDSGLRIDGEFIPNSPTPTVAFGRNFRTRNLKLTHIERFADPNSVSARAITVVVDDGNTIFTSSGSGFASLRLIGGEIAYAAPRGSEISFVWDNSTGQWREVSRSEA